MSLEGAGGRQRRSPQGPPQVGVEVWGLRLCWQLDLVRHSPKDAITGPGVAVQVFSRYGSHPPSVGLE